MNYNSEYNFFQQTTLPTHCSGNTASLIPSFWNMLNTFPNPGEPNPGEPNLVNVDTFVSVSLTFFPWAPDLYF